MLTVEEIKEYQNVHRRLFQCEISMEDAAEQ